MLVDPAAKDCSLHDVYLCVVQDLKWNKLYENVTQTRKHGKFHYVMTLSLHVHYAGNENAATGSAGAGSPAKEEMQAKIILHAISLILKIFPWN